ncbi:transposase [Rhodohalobacter mucosus]|uniref:Transposase IS200-like domain-containing protein n=1 Tax=Rhodohalobacter mucosus TaxID=2079485 RepID=A0A316TXE0_9BACT|nr:transposase [Rhodohalobacter mucosus]PWN07312.1 hypothetical protein DDZ15_03320 [Rhodohalobacter mucosus]
MKFYPGELYHIFNRGNIRQKVFFESRNYIFFLEKMKTHLTPYCHILAWCLMPNHFHWLIKVKDNHEIERNDLSHLAKSDDQTNNLHSKCSNKQLATHHTSTKVIAQDGFQLLDVSQLNQNIGIMLRSYTRAINNAQKSKGSLFQQGTKSKNVNPGIEFRENYALICFLYILQNPVRAKLSADFSGWPYSAYLDYSGQRNGTLCNKELATELFNLPTDWNEFKEFVSQSLPENFQDHIF